MTNVITAVFAVAAIIGAAVTLSDVTLSSATDAAFSWEQMVERSGASTRTNLGLIQADINSTSTDVDISMRNTGQTALVGFSNWDVVVQYYATTSNQGLRISWLTHTTSSSPSHEEWTVEGIYLNAASSTPEVYEPNVFNPGEEMVVRLNITPVIPTSTDSVVTVGVRNGTTLSALFSR